MDEQNISLETEESSLESTEIVEASHEVEEASSETRKPNKTALGIGATLLVVAAVVAALVLSGTLSKDGFKSPFGPSADKVAAVVNGHEIATATLDSEMSKLGLSEINESLTADLQKEYRSQILDELIAQELLLEEAKAEKVLVSDKDIDEAVDSVKVEYGDDEAFNEALASAGYTLDSYKKEVRWQLSTNALVEKAVPEDSIKDEELRPYYDSNIELFSTEAAKRTSHILYSVEDKAKAEEALKEIKGGADFAEIAKAESIDSMTAPEGGDLGWPTTSYVPEFQAAVDELEPGDDPKLVQSVYGYHIVKVTDKRDAGVKDFDAARGEVKQAILNEKRTDAYLGLVDKLRATADIKVLDQQVSEFRATQEANQDTQ